MSSHFVTVGLIKTDIEILKISIYLGFLSIIVSNNLYEKVVFYDYHR